MSPDLSAAMRYVALDALVALTLTFGVYLFVAVALPRLARTPHPAMSTQQGFLLGVLVLGGAAVLVSIWRFRRRPGSDAAAFLRVRQALGRGEPLDHRGRQLASALRFANTRPLPLSGQQQAWLVGIFVVVFFGIFALDGLTHRDPDMLVHLAGLVLIPVVSGLVLRSRRRRLIDDIDRAVGDPKP